MATPNWPDAACLNQDPDLFYPINFATLDAAVSICASCPRKVQCAEVGEENGERQGVWGAEYRGPLIYKFDPAKDTDIYRLYCDGNTDGAIAAQLDVDPVTILRWRMDRGLPSARYRRLADTA